MSNPKAKFKAINKLAVNPLKPYRVTLSLRLPAPPASSKKSRPEAPTPQAKPLRPSRPVTAADKISDPNSRKLSLPLKAAATLLSKPVPQAQPSRLVQLELPVPLRVQPVETSRLTPQVELRAHVALRALLVGDRLAAPTR